MSEASLKAFKMSRLMGVLVHEEMNGMYGYYSVGEKLQNQVPAPVMTGRNMFSPKIKTW